jgi:hypothetical protein
MIICSVFAAQLTRHYGREPRNLARDLRQQIIERKQTERLSI